MIYNYSDVKEFVVLGMDSILEGLVCENDISLTLLEEVYTTCINTNEYVLSILVEQSGKYITSLVFIADRESNGGMSLEEYLNRHSNYQLRNKEIILKVLNDLYMGRFEIKTDKVCIDLYN
ncbi:MAG: hypothetical protein ACRDBY_14400 [Cetobacterium sp.]